MPEKEFIGDKLVIKFEGTVSLDELHKAINSWYKLYGFKVKELEHRNLRGTEGNELLIRLEGKKSLSDYVDTIIATKIEGANVKPVEAKNKRMHECKLTITLLGWLSKDKDDVWKKSALTKFLRESYDKFVIGDKISAYLKNTESELKKLYNEIRAFLNIKKL